MNFCEKLFQTKLLSRLSHKVCRLLSSPVLLRKFTNDACKGLAPWKCQSFDINSSPVLSYSWVLKNGIIINNNACYLSFQRKYIVIQWRIQGRSPGGQPPLFLDQTEALRAENCFFFWRPSPPSSMCLDDQPPPPPSPSISRSGSGTVSDIAYIVSSKARSTRQDKCYGTIFLSFLLVHTSGYILR